MDIFFDPATCVSQRCHPPVRLDEAAMALAVLFARTSDLTDFH